MNDCIFCKIVTGESPSTNVYEDKNHLAFLDTMPVNKGHTLVIPKKHYENILDIPPEELKELIEKIQLISDAIKKSLNTDGFNIVQFNGESSGQTVPHLHFHIIPRHKGDGFTLNWRKLKYDEDEKKEISNKIRSELK